MYTCIYIYINTELLDGNQGHQEETVWLWTHYCSEHNEILSILIICPKHSKMIEIVPLSVLLTFFIFRSTQIQSD